MSETKQATQLMTEGSIVKHIVRFSIPLLVGNLLQQSYNLVDMIIVGRCINDGGRSIAAVGVGGAFIMMMIGLFMGLATGAGIVISNAYGAGRMKRVRKTIRLSLVMSALMSVGVTVVSIAICDWVLTLLNATEEIFDMASLYLKIYFVGFIPLLVYNMGTSILQALGNSKSPFWYLFATCIMNLAMDLIFIEGFGMGVEGAALATTIATAVACGLVLRKIYKSGMMIDPDGDGSPESLDRSRYLLTTIIRYGVPIGIQSLTMSLSNMVLQGNMNQLGTDVIAAWSIFGKIDGYVIMPVLAFRMAITTFAGQNYGGRRLDRVEASRRIVTGMSVGCVVLIGALVILFYKPIVMIFEPSQAVMEYCRLMAYYMVPFYFTLAFINVYTGLLNGLGKPLIGSAVMILCMCVIRVATVSVTFPAMHNLMAIVIAYYVSWFSCMFILLGIYHFRLKKQLGLNQIVRH